MDTENLLGTREITLLQLAKLRAIHSYIFCNAVYLALADRSKLAKYRKSHLNKGEYRYRLPHRVFFADQGALTIGDYREIMHKASYVSLVCYAILYWNTIKINDIVESLR